MDMSGASDQNRSLAGNVNVKIGVSADLAPFFDAVLKRRDMPATVERLESGSLTYTFPAGIARHRVVEMLEEAYTLRMGNSGRKVN